MAISDLIFEISGDSIYGPQLIDTTSTVSIVVTNLGATTMTGLGVYLIPATDLGDVDRPADETPDQDYQDVLDWGEDVDNAVETTGGLKVTATRNDATTPTVYFSRTAGYDAATRIPFEDLAENQSTTLEFELETPPSVLARRLYISISFESD